MLKAISEIHNVHISGKGNQPMMFAHGLGCDQSIWRYVAPAFEESYKVVLFDYIGSGKSDLSYYDDQRYSNLYGYAEDVLKICRECNLQNVIFIGHSVSCMIGLLAAIEQPSLFSNLIMLTPSPRYLNDADYKGGFEKLEMDLLMEMMETNYNKWASYLAPAIIGDEGRPDLEREMKERFCIENHEITKKFAKVNFFSDSRPFLSQLTTDTLIMQCVEDMLAPVEVGWYLKNKIENSELRLLKARGHCPHLSAPNETINVINAYVQAKRVNKE